MKALAIAFTLLVGSIAHAQHWDVLFPNEPNEAAKEIMVSCKELPRGKTSGTYWNCLVSEENYAHADMPGNKRDPNSPQAKAFLKPNPKGGDDIPVGTYGLKRLRSKPDGGNIHPKKLKAIKIKKAKVPK